MLTLYKETVGTLHLVLRSDGSIYLGRPDEHGVMDVRETLRLGGSSAICTALAEALGRVAERVRAGVGARFEEEKPPMGHHAEPKEES